MNIVQTHLIPTSRKFAQVISLIVIQKHSRITTFWSLWDSVILYYQVTFALNVHVAGIIFWEILFQALEVLLKLLDWNILLAIVNYLQHIILRDVFSHVLQHHTCIWQILLIVIENLLHIHYWDILAIFLNQCQYFINRSIFFLQLKLLFQLVIRNIFLIIIDEFLNTSKGKVCSIAIKQ